MAGLDAFCEPFRAWNRLEPRPRKKDFDRTLKSEIHDPLWMLTRQWQFGEFKGEDTGSAIFAKIQIETARLNKFKIKGGTTKKYSDDIPLETVVEAESYVPDFKLRLQGASTFLKYLDLAFDGAVLAQAYQRAAYQNILLELYPMAVPSIDEELDANELIVEKAKQLSNRSLRQWQSACAGRSFDSWSFYNNMLSFELESINSIISLTHESHRPFLETAINNFNTWMVKQTGLPAQKEKSAWNSRQLEYQFSCALPNAQGNNTVLCAEEYYNGRLDWYSFDLDPKVKSTNSLAQSTATEKEELIDTHTFSFIPTPATFAGMPNARWWEFEDGQVDLGNISADTTDIAKILLAEFALIYGNDWFVVPYPLPVGSLSEVKGIVVTDVFGQKTLVESAIQGESDDWMSWGMFNLSQKRVGDVDTSSSDTRLFVPPALTKVQESEAVESIHLVRDEMANMVWAIETKISNLMGKGLDAHAAANELVQFLQLLDFEGAVPTEIDPEVKLNYILGNTVPENWIPFIPVHLAGQNREIQLQRASMPRLFRGEFKAIRPRTQLMRVGFNPDPNMELLPLINPENGIQNQPYYLNEEEVPRAGANIISTFQRARWYNGATFGWYGHRKTTGRGEAGSGLQYDIIEHRDTAEAEEV